MNAREPLIWITYFTLTAGVVLAGGAFV